MSHLLIKDGSHYPTPTMDRAHRLALYIARTLKHLDPKIPSINKCHIINFCNTKEITPRPLWLSQFVLLRTREPVIANRSTFAGLCEP